MQWPRVIIFTALVVFVLIDLILCFEGPPSAFLIFFFLCLSLFIGERKLRFHCQKICYKKKCRCGCHTINKCNRKCHHWCRVKSDADLCADDEDTKENEKEVCQDCFFSHEIFKDVNFGPYNFQECICRCHEKRKGQRVTFRCACHCWCQSKSK